MSDLDLTLPQLSFNGRQWIVRPVAPGEADDVVASILTSRNYITPETRDSFLNPRWPEDVHDPFLFRDMRKAVDRILAAVKLGERITMYGDYDADGVSAASIIADTLTLLGATFDVYLPDRETEGYGLNRNAVGKFADNGTKILITGDCGISNIVEITYARERGIDVIVTDHHERRTDAEGKEILPPAFAILHPHVAGETYPREPLSGGGVAFKLAQGLLRSHDGIKDYASEEKWLLDLVAISSVADVVPLVGEVRVLVHYGLMVINRTRRLGLQKLMERARITLGSLDTEDIGFRIAPRINAAGRMQHANGAYVLLTTSDQTLAATLADELETANSDRQKMVELIVKEVKGQVETQGEAPVLFAHGDDWPVGLLGLVAGRVMDAESKPVFISTGLGGRYHGSGRSPHWFHCTDALKEVADIFDGFGGHARACGFHLKEDVTLDTLRGAMIEIAGRTSPESATSELVIDAEVTSSGLTLDLADRLARLAPYGEGNRQPGFLLRDVTVVRVNTVGASGSHLKLMVKSDTGTLHKFIGFKFGSRLDKMSVGSKLDIVFEIDTTVWNDNRELELKIIDARVP